MTAFTVHFEPPKEMSRSTFDAARCQKYTFVFGVLLAVGIFLGVIAFLAWSSISLHF